MLGTPDDNGVHSDFNVFFMPMRNTYYIDAVHLIPIYPCQVLQRYPAFGICLFFTNERIAVLLEHWSEREINEYMEWINGFQNQQGYDWYDFPYDRACRDRIAKLDTHGIRRTFTNKALYSLFRNAKGRFAIRRDTFKSLREEGKVYSLHRQDKQLMCVVSTLEEGERSLLGAIEATSATVRERPCPTTHNDSEVAAIVHAGS